MTYQDYTPQIERVIEHLSGHPVRLCWKAPYLKNVSAIAYRDKERGAVIEVAPQAGDQTTWHLLLHECAHVRLDWDDMRPGTAPSQAPGSVELPPGTKARMMADSHEIAAERLAGEWMEYAEAHHWQYINQAGYGGLTARLQALLDWEPVLETKIINIQELRKAMEAKK